ncbi:MAG: ATP-binding protein [Synergistaceae bacterium]|nr:ATP-binding protein [Synergistaceae bacterium]
MTRLKKADEMTSKPLKLPIGIQTFGIIRTEGYLYVDKTKYLVDLIDNGRIYFMSRPRRFGKSLTVSTFDALFSGKKELFRGLYAEEFTNRPDYKTYPVVRLDMSDLTVDMGPDVLRASMLARVKENGERLGVKIGDAAPGDAFSALLKNTAQRHRSQTVLLIDEYDSPILQHVSDHPRIEKIREILKNFYVRIKAADEYLRFVFMTGISKFSKMGVFSALNNLEDISTDNAFAAMLGYTEEELLSNFDGYLDKTALTLEMSKEDLIARIRDYYDGFSFDGKTRLYNPFSALNFFKKREFLNFWFESGTPSFLADYVKRHDLEAENFRGFPTDDEFAMNAEIEHAPPESFLFQSGYLSIREKIGRKLILDYPNMEVMSSVSKLFLREKFEIPGAGFATAELEESLARGDAESIVKTYNALLASLPYDIYERETRKYDAEHAKTGASAVPYAESFFHALLFSMLWSSRVNTTAENHGYKGRSDIEAEKNGYCYVIELKAADGKEASEKAAEAAMRQIREKGYADKHAQNAQKNVTLLGLAVDKKARRVERAVIERL